MVLKTLFYAGAAAALVVSAPAYAVDEKFAARADAMVKAAYPAQAPGVAAIVMERGRVVYVGGSGMADLDKKTPITADTVFRLGSITKQFSAAVILQLVAEGKLSLDDPLAKFLPDYPAPGARATIRQLLNHTSGIKSYTGMDGWMAGTKPATDFTTAQLIAEFKDQPADFPAGERFSYNNSGYVLIGAVIEAVTGRPWHEAVIERIAKPLGLASIRYGGDEPKISAFARGYSAQAPGKYAPSRPISMTVPHAAGALLGTVGDLAKWAQALHHGKVVTPALYAEMIAPTKLASGETAPYGYGLAPQSVRGLPAVGHGGGIFGFTTSSLYVPERDLFVAVFANADSGLVSPEITSLRITAEAVGKPFPAFTKADFDPAALAPAFGVYRIAGTEADRRFFLRDGQLYTKRDGANESKVYAAGGNRYFYGPDSLNWFEIVREPNGGYAMLMHQNGSDLGERAVRTGALPPEAPAFAVPRAVLQSYAGSYTSAFAPIAVDLREDGVLTLRFGTQQPTALRALSESEFAAIGVEAKVAFQRSGAAVTGLVIHQGGRELPASRDPAMN